MALLVTAGGESMTSPAVYCHTPRPSLTESALTVWKSLPK